MEQRMCIVCGVKWGAGTGSPYGHVKEKGTIVLPKVRDDFPNTPKD